MWCCNSMHAVCDYASGATYRECPNIEQIRNGVIPLDSLPAAWWNWMWWDTNKAVNEARSAVGMFLNEMETVLCAAGVTACCTCVDNLYCAIEKIRTTVGTSLIAGAVKSSSCGGQVTIENDGTMTMNGVGNAANLTTTSKQVVGAINELKSTYDNCWTNNTTALSGKAPNAHASSETTYGVGNADCYGHLKISDTYSQVLTACAGVAASQKALACVYSAMTGAGYTTLGNTAGCALGTAAAGSANTAARSDHVHPKQTCVECAGKDGSGCAFGTAARCAATAFRASDWTPTTVTNANKVCTTVATANSDRNLLLGEAAYTGTCCAGVYVGNSCKATFNPSTGVLKATCFCGTASCAACAKCLVNIVSGASLSGLIYFCTNCTNSSCASTPRATYICGANGYYYGNICGDVCGIACHARYSTSASNATCACCANCLINFGCASVCATYGCATSRQLGPFGWVQWSCGALQCDIWKAIEYSLGSAVGCTCGTCARPISSRLFDRVICNCRNSVSIMGYLTSSSLNTHVACTSVHINNSGCDVYISAGDGGQNTVTIYRGCACRTSLGGYTNCPAAAGHLLFSNICATF